MILIRRKIRICESRRKRMKKVSIIAMEMTGIYTHKVLSIWSGSDEKCAYDEREILERTKRKIVTLICFGDGNFMLCGQISSIQYAKCAGIQNATVRCAKLTRRSMRCSAVMKHNNNWNEFFVFLFFSSIVNGPRQWRRRPTEWNCRRWEKWALVRNYMELFV